VSEIRLYRNLVHCKRHLRILCGALRHETMQEQRRAQLHAEMHLMQRAPHGLEQCMPGQENADRKSRKCPKKPTYVLRQLWDGGTTLERPRHHRTRPNEYRTSEWTHINANDMRRSKFDIFRGTSLIERPVAATKVRSFIPKCHVPSHSFSVSSPLYDNRVSALSARERRLAH